MILRVHLLHVAPFYATFKLPEHILLTKTIHSTKTLAFRDARLTEAIFMRVISLRKSFCK